MTSKPKLNTVKKPPRRAVPKAPAQEDAPGALTQAILFGQKEMLDRLAALEEGQKHLQALAESGLHNLAVVYRRTAALAHMIEAMAEGKEPRIPSSMRAEIDASFHPQLFVDLAEKDTEEFVRRYGKTTLAVYRKYGLRGISRISDFAPAKQDAERIIQ